MSRRPADLFVLVGTARAGLKDEFPVILESEDESSHALESSDPKEARRLLRWAQRHPYFSKWRPIRVVRYRAVAK